MSVASSDTTKSGRLGVPRPGRPFTTEAADWSRRALDAEELLLEHAKTMAFDGPMTQPGIIAEGGQAMDPQRRAARRLIGAWITGVVTGQLDFGSTLADGEKWFVGNAECSDQLPVGISTAVKGLLGQIVDRPGAFEMLPYVFDPMPHAYRRDVVAGRDPRARHKKKASGSFYTPIDVVEHIVDQGIAGVRSRSESTRVLDPACGTGVFLRQAFRGLIATGMDAWTAMSSLHGVDIDECAVDMAAFVLLADWLTIGSMPSTVPVGRTWDDIRARLVCADTLVVLSGQQSDQLLPGLVSDSRPELLMEKFSLIIGNPPYARLGDREDFDGLRQSFRSLNEATPATNMYVAFLELLCSSLADDGAGSLVVPMSIGYGSGRALRSLRALADEVGGRWSFEFYDRTPDALFGDDVKQRTAIVTRQAGTHLQVVTGPVMRWTSRNRQDLFSMVPRVPLGPEKIVDGVPKLGSALQAEAYARLRAAGGVSLDNDLRGLRRVTTPFETRANAVYIAGTAYNWLSVYRDGRAVADGVDRPSRSSVLELDFTDSRSANAAYALLVSRLVYWLWRVEGDAFHVTASWTRRIPVAVSGLGDVRIGELSSLGSQLWKSIAQEPIRSVNKGRTTVTFCPYARMHLIDEIDRRVLEGTHLPESLRGELITFVSSLTTAGRESPDDHGLRRALASWGDHGQ